MLLERSRKAVLCRRLVGRLDCGSEATRGFATYTRNVVVIIPIIIDGNNHLVELVGEEEWLGGDGGGDAAVRRY